MKQVRFAAQVTMVVGQRGQKGKPLCSTENPELTNSLPR